MTSEKEEELGKENEESVEDIEKEEEQPVTAPEDSVLNLIKGLREESQQIVDLKEIERLEVTNVVSNLRRLIEPIAKSYQIVPSSLHRIDKNVTGVILTPQGTLCLFYTNGLIVTKSLDNLSSESLVKVLDQVLPEVKKHFAEQRRRIAMRTTLLERVAGELKVVSDGTSVTRRRVTTQKDSSQTKP